MKNTFNRHLYSELLKWKANPNRKPLIIRGARQVGKTTLVRQFAKSYRHFISLNLERPTDLNYFNQFTDAQKITDALLTANNITSNQKTETLLFIDEIQESPSAMALLRYFYEDEPELHVIAAGSLLEHVMKHVQQFPVGRVSYLYLHALNFTEYLEAKKQSGALGAMQQVPIVQHHQALLLDLFHEYAIVGGMPEVVATYLATGSVADLQQVYESIWATYKNDVEKYATSQAAARVIKHVINTAHLYLDERIAFQNFGNSNYKSREVGEALRNLHDARVIQLIYPTTSLVPPLKPDLKKAPRLQFLDTGLVNYALGIQAQLIPIADLSTAYKGALIPHLIAQELQSLSLTKSETPHFWVRQKANSSAEVDLVVPHGSMLLPVEIKSGMAGTLKSLHQFIEQAPHPYAVRIYGGTFCIEQQYTPGTKKPYWLMNLPYYLGSQLPKYLDYFLATVEGIEKR